MDRGRFYTSLMMLVLICQGQGQDGHLPTVGCILKSELCIAGEICINDGLFGNCQSNGSPVDHYEYDLSFGQLQDLELVVTSLVRQGHRWSEAYTQCILGTILDAFRLGITIGTDSIMDSCDLLLPRAAAVSPSADHDGQYTSDQQVAQDVDRQLQRQKDKALQDAFDDVIKQYQAQAYADEIGKVGGTDSSSEISAGDLGDVDKRVASSSDQIADAVAGDDQLSSLSNLRSDRTSSAANDGEENGVAAAKTEQEEDPTLSRHKYTKSHKRAEEAGQEEEEEIMPSNADILNLEPRYSDAQGGFPSYLTKSAKSIPEDDDDFSDKLSSFDLPMTSPNGPQGERTVGVADTEKGGAEGETYRNILSGISEQDLRDIVRYLNILEREEEDRQITAASEAAVKLMTSGQASSPVQGQDGNKADIPARSEDNDKPTNGDINGVQAIIDNMPSEDAVLLNDLIMGRITPSLLPRETVDKMVAYVNRILSDPPGGVTDSQGGVVAVPDLQNGVGAGDDLTSDGVRGSTDGGDDDDGGAAAGGDVAEGAGGGAGGGAGVGGAMSDEPVIGENPVDPPLDLPSKKDSIDKRLMGEGEGGVEFKNEYAIAESPKAKTKVKVVALNRAEKKDGDQQVAKPITSDENNLDLLNSNSVFISVNPQLKSMEEAYSITDTLAGILDLSPHVFYDIKFNEKGVSFGVEKNFLNINATMVATLAGNHSDLIKSSTNFTVTMAGIGDNKVHVTVLNTSRPDLIMAILTLCACVACVLLCALLVFAIKKRSSAKRVDRDLSPEEASGSAKGKQHPQSTNKEAKNATNDYQDLCRQHMQNKLSEKPEPLQNVARGTSVSTCDANSPSSRSSTSSWFVSLFLFHSF